MALIKPMELEELVDETSGKEVVATPAIVDRFAELNKKYKKCLMVGSRLEQWLKDHVQEIFLPPDINIFLQSTHEFENDTDYNYGTGFFISHLIQNSYNAGNSKFELDVCSLKPIGSIASNIFATKERTIQMIIKGRTGDWLGHRAEHSMFTIEKAGDTCGEYAQYSTFTIKEVGSWCWFRAENSTFTIEKAGDRCGREAQHSTFTIEKAGDQFGYGAQHSVFQTHNPEQYERFTESINQNKGNKVYLLSDTGSIIQGGLW